MGSGKNLPALRRQDHRRGIGGAMAAGQVPLWRAVDRGEKEREKEMGELGVMGELGALGALGVMGVLGVMGS